MTNVVRIPILVPGANNSLDDRIKNLCDVQEAAGYYLVGLTTVGVELIFIFQKPM